METNKEIVVNEEKTYDREVEIELNGVKAYLTKSEWDDIKNGYLNRRDLFD